MPKKRPFIDYGDLLILLGVAAMNAGFILLDWRLGLIFTGAVLVVMGLARLRRIEKVGTR